MLAKHLYLWVNRGYFVISPFLLRFFCLLRRAGDAEAGARLFSKTCGGCHSVGENARGGFGPQLNGIIGRPAGTTADYQYSDAMKNSGVVWTRDKLAAYIEAPKKVVSGTRMIFWGISDPQKIDNLLAYLETFQGQ